MNVPLALVVFFISVFGFAVVNAVEIAVVASNRIRVRHLAEQGSRAARTLEGLHAEQEKFFSAIVLMQNILSVLAATMGALILDDQVGGLAAILISIFGVSVVLALLGEITPKVLASHAREGFAVFVAIPAKALTIVLAPIVAALSFLPSLLSKRLFGVRLDAGPTVTEAELRMLIDISAESGEMRATEAILLEGVFQFGDRQVHEVMTHRTETVGIEKTSTLGDFLAVYDGARHSRFPVFEENLDNVIGILVIKDVLAKLAAGEVDRNSPIEPLVRLALLVPRTKLVSELFREMQARGDHFAVAVDEFGGTAGIVTLEQLLEEIVGPVRDEALPEEAEITILDERTRQIQGGLGIDAARAELALEIPDGNYDTVAGYVLSALGHIPRIGESVTLDGHLITVEEMRGLKIEHLRVTRT